MSAPRLPENTLRLRPMPLHSGLSMTEQMEVFEPSPPDTRKVIVATNIAEVSPHPLPHLKLKFPLPQASITIERVKFVVDCGFVKVVDAPCLQT
jgi:ATP-dependent RNA helicase DDX35